MRRQSPLTKADSVKRDFMYAAADDVYLYDTGRSYPARKFHPRI